jgi:hypothetical protein
VSGTLGRRLAKLEALAADACRGCALCDEWPGALESLLADKHPWSSDADGNLVCPRCGRPAPVRLTYEDLLGDDPLALTDARVENEAA